MRIQKMAEQIEEGLPTKFRIFRTGLNKSTNGTFDFSPEQAERVMSVYQERGVPRLPIDRNHDMLGFGSGEAAGWFTLALSEAGDLEGTDVEWTPDAKEELGSKKWGYLSPAFLTSDDGKIERLINVALTCLPALDNPVQLVALSETLGCKVEDLPVVFEAQKQAVIALKEELASVSSRLKSLEGLALVRDKEDFLKENWRKFTPAELKSWVPKASLEFLCEYVKTAPDRTTFKEEVREPGRNDLTEDELKTAKKMGIKPEVFAAVKAQKEGR